MKAEKSPLWKMCKQKMGLLLYFDETLDLVILSLLTYIYILCFIKVKQCCKYIYYKSRLYYRYDVEEYFQNDLCHYEYSNELSF